LNKLIEDDKTELKSILNDKFEREVIAFLNSRTGGDIYIGIKDSGEVIGIEDIDKTQLIVSDRIKNNILPTTLGLFDIKIEEKVDKNVLHIIVSSGTEKPYYLKAKGMSPAGCSIRIGNGVKQMDIGMIEKMFAGRTRNSLRNITSQRYSDHGFKQLKIYYEEKGYELNNTFLHNLDLFTEDGKYNYVAYLLADLNSVSMKVAKYSGTNKINLIENEEYGFCSLIKATERILSKLEIENRSFTSITGAARRNERKMIDRIALREAFINAVVHNDYTREVPPVVEIFSDKLVITSYGGLVEGLTLEEFFNGRSIPRNRELMRIFKDLELVEQLGSGMNRILSVYSNDIFSVTENFIQITFPINATDQVTEQVTEQVSEQVSEQVNQLILHLGKNELNLNELMVSIKIKHRPSFLYNYIHPSIELGLLEQTMPESPNSPKQKYRLTNKGKLLLNTLLERRK